MPMVSMQLRSLRGRVRALAGSILMVCENVHPGTSALLYFFVCIGAAKSRRAVPATEGKIGEVFETVIYSDCGKRKLILRRYR